MSEEGKKEEDKQERRFSQEQYDMLKRCSDAKDMTEWMEWRKKHPDKAILLKGANLEQDNLQNAYFGAAILQDADLWDANLKDASLQNANLQNAGLRDADLQNVDFRDANLQNADFRNANMQGAKLDGAHLENAELRGAHLENAKLWGAHLEGAHLNEAHLEDTYFRAGYLQGAIFYRAYLNNANFCATIVDGTTSFWEVNINRKTDFRGVGLDSCRIDAGTKQLLKYNIRRMNWEEWYKEHWLLRWPVQAFWAMSDYGMSTLRVIGVFFLLALLFAGVYMYWGYTSPPGIVSNLVVQPEVGEASWHYLTRAVIRPIYFSVVTMTTLGFGDMYANKGSIAGHILLILQVILGYVLLGALITRFAVLFTAGGPAGKFAKEKKDSH